MKLTNLTTTQINNINAIIDFYTLSKNDAQEIYDCLTSKWLSNILHHPALKDGLLTQGDIYDMGKKMLIKELENNTLLISMSIQSFINCYVLDYEVIEIILPSTNEKIYIKRNLLELIKYK